MKILIAGSINEYSSNEEEAIVKLLTEQLRKKGHTVDNFLLPYKPDALTLLDQILAYNMLDVGSAELLITVGYPACTINHHRKIIYLLETAPMLHEYWDSEYGILGNRQYSDILIMLREIERRCFTEAQRLICASGVLSDDLKSRYGLTAQVLEYPVLSPKETAKADDCGEGYFVTESCLLQNSRFLEFTELVKENTDVKVSFFIPSADSAYYESLSRVCQGLEDRIKIYSGSPSDSVLKESLGYIHFPYEARRPDNILNRCVKLGVPVTVSEDSGYGAQLSREYGNIRKAPFDSLFSAAAGRTGAVPGELITPEEFAEKVMSL